MGGGATTLTGALGLVPVLGFRPDFDAFEEDAISGSKIEKLGIKNTQAAGRHN